MKILITSLEIGPIEELKNSTYIYAIQFERLTVSGPCTLHEFLNEQSYDPRDGLYNPKIAIAKVRILIIDSSYRYKGRSIFGESQRIEAYYRSFVKFVRAKLNELVIGGTWLFRTTY